MEQNAAWCEECGQRVEYHRGAWWCPLHRDLGHVTFTRSRIPPAEKISSGEESENMPTNRTWSPAYLGRAILNQGETWIIANGDWLKVAEMRPKDALHALLMLERVVDDLPIKRDELQETALYKALYKRVTLPRIKLRVTNGNEIRLVLESAIETKSMVRLQYSSYAGHNSVNVLIPSRIVHNTDRLLGDQLVVEWNESTERKVFYLSNINWVEEV